MTTTEFKYEFNLLYNNVMSNIMPGLNDWEISVFLTKGQEELLKNYFNPNGNKYKEGFDDSTARQFDFVTLMEVTKPFLYTNEDYIPYDDRSFVYKVRDDILAIVNEWCYETVDGHTIRLNVVPINYEEYNRLITRPYPYPLKHQAWRLMNKFSVRVGDPKTGEWNGETETVRVHELIGAPNREITNYTIRYVRKPCPIIVCDLETNFPDCSVDGITRETQCELDASLHREIVQRAVELAKAAYVNGDTATTVQMGARSE